MRIAVLGDAGSPHVIKWVNALTDAGHELVLYSMPNQRDELGEIRKDVEVVYLPVAEAAGGIKKNAASAKEYISAGNFKATAAFDMLTYGAMAARAKIEHVLLVSTGLDIVNAVKSGQSSKVVKIIAEAAAVCATAPNVITRIKDVYKKDKPYFVTPFGVDMNLFCKKDVPRSDAFTFGSLKSFAFYDHVEYVIEAFGKFCQKTGMKSLLRVVGSGHASGDLHAKVQELGLEDKVEFLGHVRNSDMPGVINTMDVVVQMPEDECLGISGIEAMACEVPVISSDTDGASEYILNGVTGFLVKTGNVEKCSDKMLELAMDTPLRESMGFHSRQDVMELYNLPSCIQKFETALQAASGSRVN